MTTHSTKLRTSPHYRRMADTAIGELVQFNRAAGLRAFNNVLAEGVFNV